MNNTSQNPGEYYYAVTTRVVPLCTLTGPTWIRVTYWKQSTSYADVSLV